VERMHNLKNEKNYLYTLFSARNSHFRPKLNLKIVYF